MHLEGREVETVDDIIEAFRSTIKERRSLMRIRSDYMTSHLHHTTQSVYGRRGENLNLAVKNITAKFEACDFENMRPVDILIYTLIYSISHENLKERCFELWKEKQKNNSDLEEDKLIEMMRSWFENHSNATEKPYTKTDRVHLVIAGDTPPTACR